MTTLLDLYHIQRKLTQALNNARHVVQAHFRNCHPSHHVHRILQYIYAINISQYPIKKKKSSLMAQTMHLALFGPVFVATTPPIAYFIDYNHISYKYQLVFQKKKKNSLMAQMTPNVSIWACFCHHCPSHCVHCRS